MSQLSRAEINPLEISAFLKNHAKNQNLLHDENPVRLTEISLFQRAHMNST